MYYQILNTNFRNVYILNALQSRKKVNTFYFDHQMERDKKMDFLFVPDLKLNLINKGDQ